jgi:hypothetical protein
MARSTSTQRGASRRTTRTASGGPGSRGAAAPRSRKPSSSARGRKPAPARSRVRRPAGPWVPVAIVALVVVLGWSLYPAMRLQYQASRRMADLTQQYDSLRQRNDALRAQVAELKTPQGVEKAARGPRLCEDRRQRVRGHPVGRRERDQDGGRRRFGGRRDADTGRVGAPLHPGRAVRGRAADLHR